MAGSLSAPESGVTVRMYDADFGDCHLLAFRGTDGEPVYLLIDCGTAWKAAGKRQRMERVAESIHDATGARLDVVVGTHEHYDHLSGFEWAREAWWQQIEFGEVWVGWTEDPNDDLATELEEEYELRLRALRSAGERIGPRRADLRGLVDTALGFTESTDRYMEELIGRGNPTRYLRPGRPAISIPGVDGVRVYVLGPPRNRDQLRVSDTHGDLYHARANALGTMGFCGAARLAAAPGDRTLAEERLLESTQPFDETLRVSSEDAKRDAFFRKRYGFPGSRGGPAWRRIDDDWLDAAGELALQMDSYTNNTSVVLAIELVSSGRVLLFASDAQTGNWLSWHEHSWPDGDCGEDVTAADLLRRTVLYKVGHHGSHNATQRENGLELMDSPELTALIPVREETAIKSGWHQIPLPGLVQRLREKARGRVLRTDEPFPATRPSGLSQEEWDEFKGRTESVAGLYHQVRVPDGGGG